MVASGHVELQNNCEQMRGVLEICYHQQIGRHKGTTMEWW